MLTSTSDPCSGDPQCPTLGSDADITAVWGSFQGVQTLMVFLAVVIVLLTIGAIVLWLRRTNGARSGVDGLLATAAPDAPRAQDDEDQTPTS